jgi:hypothetical protein
LRIAASAVGESYDEGQYDVETSDVALIEAAYELHAPSSPNHDRFVGHYLGADPQTVSLGWINGDSEVRGIHDLRCHLANHDRGMRFRKRTSLDNNRCPNSVAVSLSMLTATGLARVPIPDRFVSANAGGFL